MTYMFSILSHKNSLIASLTHSFPIIFKTTNHNNDDVSLKADEMGREPYNFLAELYSSAIIRLCKLRCHVLMVAWFVFFYLTICFLLSSSDEEHRCLFSWLRQV